MENKNSDNALLTNPKLLTW